MTLLLGFAAVNTGNNLLYLLVSALLGFMTVSGILGRWNLAGLRLRLETPEEIYDGVETLIGLRLENRKRRLPSFLIEVRLPEGSCLFTEVHRDEAAAGSVAVTFAGRGRHRLQGAEVRSCFPINFFIRSFPLPLDQELIVFPAPLAGSPAGGAEGWRRGSVTRLQGRGSDGEITRISDYRGGEPLKLIHWRLSARHETLKVKELSDAFSSPLLIDLDALCGPLEIRLRLAAHLIRKASHAGRPVGLHGPGLNLPAAGGRAHMIMLMTALALYGLDQNAA